MFKKIGILVVLCLLLGVGCKKTEAPIQELSADEKLQQEKAEVSQAVGAITAVDQDFDGLTDEEELLLGTDPTNLDSDDDGLTDYDEVKVRKTDPLNPDTDGDGLSDGYEAARGWIR